jgi:hypothetical protein
MREHEMRMRVFRFLKARMRNMIMPATVGIGLAVGSGCEKSEAVPVYGVPWTSDAALPAGDAPPVRDQSHGDLALADVPGSDLVPTNRDSTPGGDVLADSVPDGPGQADKPSLPDAVLVADGASPSDGPLARDVLPGDAVAGEARLSLDALPDFLVKYMSPFFDAGRIDGAEDVGGKHDVAAVLDSSVPDAGGDLGSVTTKYLAQQPDAAPDGNAAGRYMAPISDAGREVSLGVLYMA